MKLFLYILSSICFFITIWYTVTFLNNPAYFEHCLDMCFHIFIATSSFFGGLFCLAGTIALYWREKYLEKLD